MEKGDLLEVINQEINIINDQDKKPGLTSWAILTALAGLLWFLINFLESNINYNINKIFEYLLVLFLIYQCFRNISSYIFGVDSNSSSPRFFSILNLKNSALFSFFIEYLIVLFLLFNVNLPIYNFLYNITKFFYILMLFSIIFIIVIVWADLPAVNKNSKNNIINFIIVLSLYFSIFINYFLNFQISFTNAKIALIVFAMVILFLKYISSFSHVDLILEKLQDIRRKIQFGYIDINDAVKQVDILIFGRKGSDLLEKKIYDTINLLQQFDNIWKELEEITPVNFEDAKNNAELMKKISNYTVQAEEIGKKLKKSTDRLIFPSNIIVKSFPEAFDDIRGEYEKINNYIENISFKISSYRQRMENKN